MIRCNWKRIYINVLILFLLTSSCVMIGCSSSHKVNDNVSDQPQTLQIGLSFDSFVIERWLRDRDAFVMTAKELGADVNVQVANGDVEEQISQIQYFIKKKMDVIVIIAVDGSALNDVVKEAKSKGIKIICYDRLIENANTDLYISFDNYSVGQDMAQALMDAIPDGGDIFMIGGSKTDHNVTMVEEGFLDMIEYSNLNVIYKESCTNWNAKLAGEAVEKALKLYPDVKGIMCGNDDLASEVFRVLSENRLAGDVCIVGQDAELSACQRVVEGTQTMTVFKQVDELAKAAAYFAVALGKGESIINTTQKEEGNILENDVPYIVQETIDDGRYEIPYYKLSCIPVTNENMDEVIISSGFHTLEDVYLNVK